MTFLLRGDDCIAVERIEQYRDVLKVILRPTKAFPEGGYFYCDSEDIDLVQSRSWSLSSHTKWVYILAGKARSTTAFHQELAYKYLGYYPDYIEHIDGLEIDNVDRNLNIVTNQQNSFNKPTKGYKFDARCSSFFSRITYNREEHYLEVVKTEVEACQLRYYLETDYLKDIMQDNYYMYDFLKDRRQDLDILDEERTKKISSEEATYKHVVRHAKDNAWFYYRYNLAEYFKDNNLPVPSYDLNERGFMVDKITRKKLCPFD